MGELWEFQESPEVSGITVENMGEILVNLS